MTIQHIRICTLSDHFLPTLHYRLRRSIACRSRIMVNSVKTLRETQTCCVVAFCGRGQRRRVRSGCPEEAEGGGEVKPYPLERWPAFEKRRSCSSVGKAVKFLERRKGSVPSDEAAAGPAHRESAVNGGTCKARLFGVNVCRPKL